MGAPSSRRWLYGPGRDLLLGCGLGYALLLIALCAFGPEVRTRMPAGLIPFLTLLVGAPHYGATLLRVYERREDRRAYAIFAVWITLVLAAVFAASTRWIALGSILFTVYITWSPWHYTGQNYGLALMFLRRRGIAPGGSLKRTIYLSFLLSYVLTFLVLHRTDPEVAYAPALYAEATYHFLPIGIPSAFADPAIVVVALADLAALAVAGIGLLRRGAPRDLFPALMLAATQALWFTIPVVVRQWHLLTGLDPFAAAHSTYYFFYAALGHSVQYVWVTSFYARSQAGYRGFGPYFWKALLAGAAVWTVPPLLFSPDWLGRLPFDAGLSALVASAVNVHHFILDGAIWKLRDGRIARVLVRSDAVVTSPPALESPARAWLRPALWAAGAVSLAIMIGASFELEVGVRRALERGDVPRAVQAARRLDWVGRESAQIHLALGRQLAARHEDGAALREYRRSVKIQPSPDAWLASADVLEAAGALEPAQQALERALALAPDVAALQFRAGRVALRRGDTASAAAHLERATELEPDREIYRIALERAEQAGRPAAGDDPNR
jgi:hypothetical protein